MPQTTQLRESFTPAKLIHYKQIDYTVADILYQWYDATQVDGDYTSSCMIYKSQLFFYNNSLSNNYKTLW